MPIQSDASPAISAVPGLTVRSAVIADAPAIRALINEVDLVDAGDGGYGLEEVESDLRRTGDLARDSWLAFDGDRLVAYAVLWPASAGYRLDVDHYVLRDAVPAGIHLLDLLTARAAEIAAAANAERADLHLALTPDSVLAVHALPARGWRNIRRHHVLTRQVTVETDEPPALPEGVTVRSVSSPEDEEVAYRLVQETFAGHFGFEAMPYADWRKRMDADHRDWSLTWIASRVDATGRPVDVGVLVGHNEREATGWVQNLGTVAAARGSGIATLLLRTAFAAFARRGRSAIGLGVDTENVNNALRFYTGLGFELQFAADTWRLLVPRA
ncbi:GNAT family N-acetyltransferase [Cryptosporangium aurantiacum]|uniref:Acetyltransferase (GNAT) family protein n=1 Tax=Cryptosporangium aurantiacum TaxID=134849 RepID=A0A1M7RP41_9ACTN|nr:GNAT family N-acetyltransferase [Cryptosporangium aurantiacum]SHN47971.1 Acetyltransferase (GNAT) family protein [Cryptosporangium aurantiacum]